MKIKSKGRTSQVLPQGRRSYGQRCAVARALDYLGERWTLLLVRELMVGPKRFKDLFDGLPGIGTNLLSGRLKGLEQAGIVSRRILPPPAGSTVYELTELGLGLEPVVFALGRWGHQFLSLRLPGEIWKPGWLMVALRAAFRADKVAGIRARYELRIDGEVFQMEIAGDKLRVAQGPPSDPDMTLTTDMRTFVGLVSGTVSPHDALRSGKASVQKGPQELRRFVALFAWGARFQELEGGAARHSQGGVGR